MVALLTKIKEKLKSYNYRHINVRLFIWLYALLILGLNVIASATKYEHYEAKQLLGIILGVETQPRSTGGLQRREPYKFLQFAYFKANNLPKALQLLTPFY